MALIDKLFNKSRNPYADSSNNKRKEQKRVPPVADGRILRKENIRLVIFQYHEKSGRSLLFDSESNKNAKREIQDVKVLCEMMFGTQVLSHKSTCFKVHKIRNPPQLMVTKVFIPQPDNQNPLGGHESFDLYSIDCLPSDDGKSTRTSIDDLTNSLPLDNRRNNHSSFVFSNPIERADSLGNNFSDSGLSSSVNSNCGSLSSSLTGSYSSRSNLYNSKSRRIDRFRRTNFDHFQTPNQPTSELVPLNKRPTKMGISLIFTLPQDDPEMSRHFEKFFFSHIVLIESYFHKLKEAINSPAALMDENKKIINEAMDGFLSSMCSLYTAPRLSSPVWLNLLATTCTNRMGLGTSFLKDFVWLIEKCCTRNTHFFLGSLLTAVLTHHLSWAPTVAPVEELPNTSYLNKPAAKWLNSLNRSHPYNPLWVQLGDLYGAVGFPLCVSRTVIVGKKSSEVVRKLLSVLSYFIRCSEIFENTDDLSFLQEMTNCQNPSNHEETICSGINDEKLFSNGSSKTLTGSSDVTVTGSENLVNSSTCCQGCINSNAILNKNCANELTVEVEPVVVTGLSKFYVDIGKSNLSLPDCSKTIVPTLYPDLKMVERTNSLERVKLIRTSANSGSICNGLNAENRVCQTSADDSRRDLSAVNSYVLQKSPDSANEVVCFESKFTAFEQPKCEMEKHMTSAPCSCSLSSLGVRDGVENTKNNHYVSFWKTFPRGTSMFDEYFDKPEDPSLELPNVAEIEINRALDDKMTLGSCRDVADCEIKKQESSITETDFIKSSAAETRETLRLNLTTDEVPRSKAIRKVDKRQREMVPMQPIFDPVGIRSESSSDSNSKSSRLNCNQETPTNPTKHSSMDDLPGILKSQLYPKISLIQHVTEYESLLRKKKNSGNSNIDPTLPSESPWEQPGPSDVNVLDFSEISMPPCKSHDNSPSSRLPDECNFGRSLLGGFCNQYMSDLVLHATDDRKFLAEPYVRLHQDLKTAIQNSVLDEHIAEATCIVADTDDWCVRLYNLKCNSVDQPLKPHELISSQLVIRLIESVHELSKLKLSPEFCLTYLEDQLQNIFLKSKVLAEFIQIHGSLCSEKLAQLLGFEVSDLPLLLAVAGTHSPQLLYQLRNFQLPS